MILSVRGVSYPPFDPLISCACKKIGSGTERNAHVYRRSYVSGHKVPRGCKA